MERELKIWINGTFDVLHIGHVKLFAYARSLGRVRVGVDTDERVRKRKGASRPVNTLADRMEFISSLRFVEDVVSFGTDDELISEIRKYEPDILVIGDDYRYKPIIGVEYIPVVRFFTKIQGKSTTTILQHEKDISNRR